MEISCFSLKLVGVDLEVCRDCDVDFLAVRSNTIQQRRVVKRAVPGSLEAEIYPDASNENTAYESIAN